MKETLAIMLAFAKIGIAFREDLLSDISNPAPNLMSMMVIFALESVGVFPRFKRRAVLVPLCKDLRVDLDRFFE